MQSRADTFRIAYLTARYPAVSHTFILREVEALRELGLDVVTCSVRAPNESDLQGEAERKEARNTFYILSAAGGIAVLFASQSAMWRTPGRYFRSLALAVRLRNPGLRSLLWQIFYFIEATILARHLKAQGISHLHNHFAGPSATVAMLAAEIAGIPFSFTLHGPDDLLCPGRWGLGEKAARARFVACISQYARSQLMLHSDPKHWGKYRIVRCGVRPEIYGRRRAHAASPRRQAPRLVFVGRLTPAKGIPVLREAYAAARRACPGLQLTIVGDGDERGRLEDLARECGGDLDLAGYRSQAEVAEILAAADIFVLPSFAEGVPVVLMEAMASGLPVVSSRITGIPELVEDGVSGILVAPGDADTFAGAIETLVRSPEMREAMGAAGQARVRDGFDVRAQARVLAALFGE